MAHHVDKMAYVGQTPWHGLGNQLSSNQPIEVWEQQAGMNWAIKEAPVQFMDTVDETQSRLITYPQSKVLYRSDTQVPLSVVSQRYQVVQPREILEFYRDLTEVSGFQLETAGVLKGGKKIWALARTGQSSTIKGNDVTNGYVLLATACDGTLATTAQLTAIRVVCNNTLAVALDGSKGAVKVPHSTAFNADAVKRELGISVSNWDAFMYRMKLLSDRKVKHAEAETFFRELFTDPQLSSSNKPNEHAMAKTLNIYNGRGRGAELGSSNGTALGLLNSITEFVDHERRARNSDYRLDSAWFGQGANLKQKALDQALLMIT
jgi:phage/plasmid-like protein (TIGR03299 family)